jgi:hypothetical protein
MIDTEKLKDILHKEKLKEDEKHIGIPSWSNEYNAMFERLGYNDLTTSNPRKITEWKELSKIRYEPVMTQQRLFWMNNASKMLLIHGIMYPLALLILLFGIYNL